tara:strand:- start:132 stop:377 length:246 start_codon:yes stop_codon:yes gene_type:complete
MLNNLKTIDNMDKPTELSLLEINNMIENINYKLECFNDEFTIQDKQNNNNIDKQIKCIENDNKVIQDLIPVALMYRMMLNN